MISDLDKVEAVCIRTAKEILSKLDPEVKAEPVVRFNLFADSSINFNVIMHV